MKKAAARRSDSGLESSLVSDEDIAWNRSTDPKLSHPQANGRQERVRLQLEDEFKSSSESRFQCSARADGCTCDASAAALLSRLRNDL